MPWNVKDVSRHNKAAAANPKKAKAWAEIANKNLSKYGDASAIRIANAAVKRMAEGGTVEETRVRGAGAAVRGFTPAKIT